MEHHFIFGTPRSMETIETQTRAGKLCFVIGQNAAHVYQQNEHAMRTILEREPKANCQPFLVVNDNADQRGIFDLAKYFNPK
jgi:thymidylate synthase